MRSSTVRLALAAAAFLFVVQSSSSASADVTITGTVGEIGVLGSIQNANQPAVRFKLTDLNQTKTCTDAIGGGYATAYAYFLTNDTFWKEWYAELLVSKKGAPISCTILTTTNCHVSSCTLP